MHYLMQFFCYFNLSQLFFCHKQFVLLVYIVVLVLLVYISNQLKKAKGTFFKKKEILKFMWRM